MADVLDIDNAEEFEVDEEGDRKYPSFESGNCGVTSTILRVYMLRITSQCLPRTHISLFVIQIYPRSTINNYNNSSNGNYSIVS
jgi:hypothetical protein